MNIEIEELEKQCLEDVESFSTIVTNMDSCEKIKRIRVLRGKSDREK